MNTDNNLDIYIVMPAYNEEAVITEEIEKIILCGYRNIVVVDDGSTDNTWEIIQKYPIHTLRHPINCGQGAALYTGIEYSIRSDADIIVTFDADGQHDSSDISLFVQEISKGQSDIILGSRFLNKKSCIGISKLRLCILRLGLLITKLFYRMEITDTHNGFRAITRSAAKHIKITEYGMAHASQFFEIIIKNNLRYKELPVTVKYTDYSTGKGQSHFNAIKIFFIMIKRLFL
ncbi:Glycosyl transferase, family 2 domain protein [Candidatus Magnetomoraceae bacterium gMMP-15]